MQNANVNLQFFAPTDAALSKIPSATMDLLLSPAGRDQLEQILSYHMVMGVIPSASLPANSDTTATSVQGSPLKVTKSSTGQVRVNGMSTVTKADVVSRKENNMCVCMVCVCGTILSPSHFWIYSLSWRLVSLRKMALSISLIQSCRCLRHQQQQQHQQLFNPCRRR
jgi:Fasciclin domain